MMILTNTHCQDWLERSTQLQHKVTTNSKGQPKPQHERYDGQYIFCQCMQHATNTEYQNVESFVCKSKIKNNLDCFGQTSQPNTHIYT